MQRNKSVTVSVTCTGIAYDAHQVNANATQVITTNVQQTLGATYSLIGDIQVAIAHATVTNQARGMVTVTVKIDATVVYQITSGEKEQMRKLIAGKTSKLAQAILLQLPGIAGAAITIKGNTMFPLSDTTTLPNNPQAITIVIAQRL